MNKVVVNIMLVSAILSLVGCTATPQIVHSQDKPIMSAADARAMIQVEVKPLEPAAEDAVIMAAVDQDRGAGATR